MKTNLLFFLILFLANSCDLPEHYFVSAPECIAENEMLQTGDPLTAENQQFLRDSLRNKSPKDFRYFFKTFEEEARNTYMITNFRNDTTCFDIKILVDNWDKLAGMRRVNGKAYPKELYDLKWQITNVSGQEEVVYIDMHDIID